jgi:proliferating cell nuclear antigen PCNA
MSRTRRTKAAAVTPPVDARAADEGSQAAQPEVWPDSSEQYLLKIETTNLGPLKILLEAIRALVNEASFVFSEDTGLRLAAVDNLKYALIHVSIPADSFDSYYCKDKVVVGLDIQLFQKIIKSVQVGDVVTFSVKPEARSTFFLRIRNEEKGSDHTWPIPMRGLPEYKINDQLAFKEAPPEMASAEFASVCNRMAIVSCENLEIQNLGEELIFIGRGGDFSPRMKYKLERPALPVEGVPEKTPELARGLFNLRFLQLFTKATALSPKVSLWLQTEKPLLLCEYKIANLSPKATLMYLLTGKDSDPSKQPV